MQLTPELILLHLTLIDGLGPAVVKRLLTALAPDQLHHLYQFGISDLRYRFQLSENLAQKLSAGLQDTKSFEREVALLEEHSIKWVSFVHPQFPQLLNEIHMPPIGIYVQGTIPHSLNALAVVGSREANLYGQRVIDRIIPPLCAQGTVIVSGGAMGIDMMAHAAAVAAKSPTVAVMGCGLLQIGREDNVRLFPRVISTGGAIISVFPLTMNAAAGHYPARNRIISGLAQGCLVVQAAKKSGALITANYALEQGREVFAVPGHIDDPLAAGCNNLLRQGATLVESADDITNVSPIFTSKPAQLTLLDLEEPFPLMTSALNLKQSTGDSINDQLISLCAKPASVDDLSGALALDMFDVQSRLFTLQMAGRVQQNFMGLWHL